MKKCLFLYVFICVVFYSVENVHAQLKASFDCNKAHSTIEKLICSDEELATLDVEMSDTLAAIKKTMPQDGMYFYSFKQALNDQRQWLKSLDEKCMHPPEMSSDPRTPAQAKMECLKYEYRTRLLVLALPDLAAPLTNAKIFRMIDYLQDKSCEDLLPISSVEDLSEFSCRYFEKDPKSAAKLFGGCFGSNRDNFIPTCNADEKIKAVSGLPEYLTQLRNMQGNDSCNGTIRYGHYRNEHAAAILALYDGDVALDDRLASFADTDSVRGFSASKSQIAHWGHQGLWEKEQYSKFKALMAKAKDGLEQYYKESVKWDKAKVQNAATYHVANLAMSYLGNTGMSSAGAYATKCWDINNLDQFLENNAVPAAGKGRNCELIYVSSPNAAARDGGENASPKAILGYLLRLAVVNDYSASDIDKILVAGAPIDGHGKNEDTPLMQAVTRPDIARLLIDHGADVNAQNAFGKTPLMYAAQYRNKETMDILLDHHADIHAKTYMADWCDSKMNFPVLNAGNRTALMYAAWHGAPDIIKALIDHGSNIHAKDSKGKEASDYLDRNEALTAQERELAKNLLQ